MRNARVIPVLLLRGDSLVKTRRFRDPRYIGDAINAVSIFSEKMVDELVLLDIDATKTGHAPRTDLIRDIASEAFIPLCYGGGVKSLDHFEALLKAGMEKVSVNTEFASNPRLIEEAARRYGSQSVVVGIDVERGASGHAIRVAGGTRTVSTDPVAYARQAEAAGAGEIMLQSIDRDGVGGGYDLELVEAVSKAVNVPVVALGGAGSVEDLVAAVRHGAAAAAAGSMFVFFGRLQGVLINTPDPEELRRAIEAAADGAVA
jgi:cyclase